MRNRRLIEDYLAETPAEQALALGLVSVMDLLRLKAIARLHAWGLPADMEWVDLLQEAILRVLQGSRKPPPGVSTVAFLAGVMRSIKEEQWRRVRREAKSGRPGTATGAEIQEPRDPAPDPERCLATRQELIEIYRLFAADRQVLQILNGLGAGLSPDEICATNGMSKTEYDSARKRMRRALLREGLAWRQR